MAVARIHINRADEEDRRRAERDASNQAEATSSQAPLSAPSRACRPYVRKPSLVELLAECRDQVRPDLVGTCNRVGIEVAVLPLRADLAGYIDCERELFVLNADTTSMRRRFTLAHQMAHWVWHHN
ncbi:ImmA/IrrE family metallo-endopeptidase, partial [Escherichia coli]|nr:ImmA/IrrE family metallo-endopeptidase [Escherichia coli]